ncbi:MULTISPECIES: lasso peptide biosynthesis B2 protein [Methanobacterium]|uniref:Lasso peptide biosynthesis B2 protein n=1 Tax=Methanobacterium veterum TaxID=408577 RepID=A0A9E5A2R2_9EURY|nr:MULTISPECIES: lasso peptide biosynthesis B2 protein [Methanobacterium]MCZ3364274.1 lasso peptide biosynthesis B2 protein [Methanobacterium veterum]MCZ3372021.1 lasso peptide biosynthesis B2 protein [Methanobacterium veterum]
MGIIHSFLKLSFEDKFILVKSFFLLWVIRIMLWILPFSVIQKIVGKLTAVSGESHNIPLEKLTWAVPVMSRYVPKATCLTRALAAQILLAGQNYNSNLKIGVSKNNGELEAHAWLEADDKIVLGESEVEYTPILNIGEK